MSKLSSPIQNYRRNGWLGHHVLFEETVGSTNDLAMDYARQGAEEGLVVITEEQMAGRGRLNRRWSAPHATSLLMTLLFRPRTPFQYHASRITMACGLAILEAISAHTNVSAQLKWPNDVIVNRDKGWGKLAGMLSEIVVDEGQPHVLVVGTGLNVNVPQTILSHLGPNATSLLAESGETIDRLTLLDTYLTCAERRIDALRMGVDVFPSWREALAWMGEGVDVITPTEIITGIAESVDEEGALILRLANGSTSRFMVGDVSLRPG